MTTYNSEIECTIASILFHNPSLLKTNLVEIKDFCGPVKNDVATMIELSKKDLIIDSKSVGKYYDMPTSDDLNNMQSYINTLKHLRCKRELQNLPKKITKLVTSGKSYDHVIADVETELEKYKYSTVKDDDVLIGDYIDEYMTKLEEGQGGIDVRSGIKQLDRFINGGFKAGQLITVAADTGSGKTTLMLNIALFNALCGISVAIFSYEMTKDEVIDIFISMLAKLNSRILTSRYKPTIDQHITKIRAAQEIIKELPIFIVDEAVSQNEIKLFCLKYRPKLICVDYLQLIPSDTDDEVKKISTHSRNFKVMANKSILNATILQVSQFSRPKDKDSEVRKLSHLKGSSSIEQDSNVVIFTHKKNPDVKTATADMKITISKNRHGPSGVLPEELMYNMAIHTIGNGTIKGRSEEFLKGEYDAFEKI